MNTPEPRNRNLESSTSVGDIKDSQGVAVGEHASADVDVHNYYGNVPYRPVDADALVEAQGRLAEMSCDEVPSVASPPQESRILLGHNRFFVGRDETFKHLAQILKGGEADTEDQVLTVAITGIAGIGKSQLASEFVHHYGQYFFGGVFWLSFVEATDVPAEVAKSGGAGSPGLGSDFGFLAPEDRVLRVMSAWQSPLPRLLVFDNCEDEKLLDRWRPPVGGCRVILTSRREIWNPRLGVRVIALDVLSREDSVALLCKFRPDLSRNDPVLEAIATELGDLPLALELAGGFLARYSRVVSPADYLAQLQSSELLRHPSLQHAKGGISPIERERDVAKTFAVSYDRLNTEDSIDRLAMAVLARAALCAPGEPIQRELLVKTLGLPEEDPNAPLRSEDALLRLAELGMLQEQGVDALRMHRLVAAFVQGVVTENEEPETIEEAQRGVEQAMADAIVPLTDEGYMAPLLALLPHLRVVTDAAKGREEERAALLCTQLGICLRMVGSYREARLYAERGLSTCEKVLGEEHPQTASSLNSFADLLQDQAEYEKARSLRERALTIRKKVLGEEHPDTAASLDGLANLLTDQGLYEEARSYFQRALEIRKEVLGETHPKTAASLNNLARLLYAQGAYEEARPYAERALEIRKEVLGETHPQTATSLNNVAILFRVQGLYEEARPLYERALGIRKEVLGEEHPATAATLLNLANLLSDQGLYEEAHLLYERGLAIHEKTLGDEHPETAKILTNMAIMLQTQGLYEEARPLYERGLAIYEKTLGNEHPETKMIRQSLRNLDT